MLHLYILMGFQSIRCSFCRKFFQILKSSNTYADNEAKKAKEAEETKKSEQKSTLKKDVKDEKLSLVKDAKSSLMTSDEILKLASTVLRLESKLVRKNSPEANEL